MNYIELYQIYLNYMLCPKNENWAKSARSAVAHWEKAAPKMTKCCYIKAKCNICLNIFLIYVIYIFILYV